MTTRDKRGQTGKLRLIQGAEANASHDVPGPVPQSKPKSPAELAAIDNPLVRQLTALADSLDRDVAALLGF